MEDGWSVSLISWPRVSPGTDSPRRRAFATEAPRSFGMNGGAKIAYRGHSGTAIFERRLFYFISP
jgi:hypothetical protein